jgi:hypothetical protein
MTPSTTDTVSRRRFLAEVGLATAGAIALAGPAPVPASAHPRRADPGADVATAWADLSLTLVQSTPGFTPPVASRAFAYLGITLYESVVDGSPRHRSVTGLLPGLRRSPRGDRGEMCWPVAANAALAAIMRSLFPTTSAASQAAIDILESSIGIGWQHRVPRAVYARSVSHGRAVASHVFAWSASDGGHEGFLRNFPGDYRPPAGPGLWVPTPTAFLPALQPTWGENRCFVIADGAAIGSGPPTPYSHTPGSSFYAEALEVYDAVNAHMPEWQAIATFWSDDPGATSTPPGHSVSIATQVLRREQASLMAAAETYARLGMAVADAFIACWNDKYVYNLLRPVTFLQAHVDQGWLPQLITPPFPEHPSGHSVQSGAAFTVLTELFGEGYGFTDHTHDDRGIPPRRFRSFGHAAHEAAISRLYGGIHFRPAIELGLAQGRRIGRAACRLPLRRDRHDKSPLTGGFPTSP